MVALYFVGYNSVRMQKSLRVSLAMAAGVSDRLWSMVDVAALVEAADVKPGKRGCRRAGLRNGKRSTSDLLETPARDDC